MYATLALQHKMWHWWLWPRSQCFHIKTFKHNTCVVLECDGSRSFSLTVPQMNQFTSAWSPLTFKIHFQVFLWSSHGNSAYFHGRNVDIISNVEVMGSARSARNTESLLVHFNEALFTEMLRHCNASVDLSLLLFSANHVKRQWQIHDTPAVCPCITMSYSEYFAKIASKWLARCLGRFVLQALKVQLVQPSRLSLSNQTLCCWRCKGQHDSYTAQTSDEVVDIIKTVKEKE